MLRSRQKAAPSLRGRSLKGTKNAATGGTVPEVDGAGVKFLAGNPVGGGAHVDGVNCVGFGREKSASSARIRKRRVAHT